MNEKDEKSIEKIDWKAVAAFLFCLLFGIAAAYLIIKYAFSIFLPFIIAGGLSFIINPISSRLSKKLKIKKKPLSAFLMAVMIALIFLIMTWAVSRLVFEGEKLIEWLASDSGRLGESIAGFFDRITSVGDRRIPLIENLMKIEQFREVWDNIDKIAADSITTAVSSLTKSIPMAMINLIGKLPVLALFLAITIISCFYFAVGFDSIGQKLSSLMPQKWRQKLPEMKKQVCHTAVKYIRAYVLLLLLTFVQLFVGFSIIKVQYPLLIALLVALIDFLPILGVGTVLIPWGLIEIFFMKDTFKGVGLLILFVIVTVVHQITEPKIVGGSLGIPPLVTIVVMYAGLKIFGIVGIIIGPIIALAVKAFLKKPSAVDTKGQV